MTEKPRLSINYLDAAQYQILSDIGFTVYPSLQSIASGRKEQDYSQKSHVGTEKRAQFGIDILDEEFGITIGSGKECDDASGHMKALGMRYGQSLLVKGNPGSLKTELVVKFLLMDLRDDYGSLFVSCHIDISALESLTIYDSSEQKAKFFSRLVFIDARNPYKTPAQIMASIRQAVQSRDAFLKIRRAVIFGIGMLDTLPAFQRESLTFLQVLIAYFRSMEISGVFVDWPQEAVEKRGQLVRPTELAGDFIAGAINIEADKDRLLILKRKEHRFVNKKLGFLQLDKNNNLIIKS